MLEYFIASYSGTLPILMEIHVYCNCETSTILFIYKYNSENCPTYVLNLRLTDNTQ